MPHSASRADIRAAIRPRATLAKRLTLSFAAATSPVFLALYVLAIPRGWGWLVLGVHAVVVLGFILVLLRRGRIAVSVTDSALVRVGLVGGHRVIPLDSIHSVVLIPIYRANAPDTATQLLLRDSDGHRLLRLDGVFWTKDALTALAAAIDKPVTRATDPMTTREFFRRYPGSAFWFQRRGFPAAAVVVTLFAFSAVVFAAMALAGIPVAPLF